MSALAISHSYRQTASEAARITLVAALSRLGIPFGGVDYADPRGMNDGGALAELDHETVTVYLTITDGAWELYFYDHLADEGSAVELKRKGVAAISGEAIVKAIANQVVAFRATAQQNPAAT